MPARRQHASFEPLPPDLDLRKLIEETENFRYVDRIAWDDIQTQGIEQFERLITLHVIIGGKPLVIDGFEACLDPWTFQPRWLRENHGAKIEHARNITTKENMPLTIGHYLRNLGLLTDQFFEKKDNYKDPNRQRMYLKDIDCPQVWQEKVKEHIPGGLFYLNESTGEIGGPGAIDEAIPNASGRRPGRGIAIAGDLMSSLPPEMRAENLMCYIGHEGTYTPAHREMCASLGQNIMVDASAHLADDGKPERPGSSIWFMTETKDRHLVAEYWLSVLGHDIEVENHFAQVAAWQRAPFNTYVVEQRAGDFVLIPPLAPHQVWNRGTRTMKVAWNRTTVETLEMALHEALPNSRMVCRDEQYKNKSIVFYTLMKYSGLLRMALSQSYRGGEDAEAIRTSKKVRQVQKDFKRLFKLWKEIMLSEMFDPDRSKESCEYLAYDSNVTCAFCRGNIFNRFLSCKTCTFALETEAEEPYDVCMDCFAMGRSCQCQSNFKWVEQWKWKDLLNRYEEWRKQIIELDGGANTEMTLLEERRVYPKRTLAEICQTALKQRPWVDIKKKHAEPEDEEEEEEIEVDDNGMVKKIKKKNKTWLKNSHACHVCCHRHAKWKMACCTMCERWWCYGSLWRAHDLHPTKIMENPSWECPHCLKTCNTGACRRDPRQKPYKPKGTLLGHDTKKVADVRSIESLVDFGSSNLQWLEIDVPGVDNPIGRMMREAEAAKAHDPTLDDQYAQDDDPQRPRIEYSPVPDHIDPALLGGAPSTSRRTIDARLDPELDLENGADAQADDFDEEDNAGADLSNVFDQQPSYGQEYEFENSMMDTNGNVQTNGDNRKKRPRASDVPEIKLVPDKRQRTSKGAVTPKGNKATKQYQVEAEKKLMDEARAEGRSVIVYAKMNNKSKIVRLSLDKAKLRNIAARPSAGKSAVPIPMRNGMSEKRSTPVIRSDIAPKIPAAAEFADGAKKSSTKTRARIEEDEDYNVKERRVDGVNEGAIKSNRKTAKARQLYAELDESDEDAEFAAGQTIDTGTSRRTRGELNDFHELPANWKDGQAKPRQRNKEPKDIHEDDSPLARPTAGKTPKIGPKRTSDGRSSSGSLKPAGCGAGRAPKAAIVANDSGGAVKMAKSAAALIQEQSANLDAKRAIAHDGAFDSASEDSSGSDSDDGGTGRPSRLNGGRSILARGKKVKIVGPRKGQPKAPAVRALPPASKHWPVSISSDDESVGDDGEEDSADEIPPRMPKKV